MTTITMADASVERLPAGLYSRLVSDADAHSGSRDRRDHERSQDARVAPEALSRHTARPLRSSGWSHPPASVSTHAGSQAGVALIAFEIVPQAAVAERLDAQDAPPTVRTTDARRQLLADGTTLRDRGTEVDADAEEGGR